jgi:DNA-binding CsgD family transcriptional regulator
MAKVTDAEATAIASPRRWFRCPSRSMTILHWSRVLHCDTSFEALAASIPRMSETNDFQGLPRVDRTDDRSERFVWMALRFRAISSRARRLAEHAQHLEQSLEASRREAEKWRREAGDLIAGLSQAIDRQLERWALSAAEKEVALLLLKGLSHKEIAGIRGVGEATVRQQAMALYRKAGLEGRHDLAAFFLEDLLEPQSR